MIPFPFGRGVFVYGEPMLVPQDVDDERLDRMRQELEHALDHVTDEADRVAGFPVEEPRPPVEST